MKRGKIKAIIFDVGGVLARGKFIVVNNKERNGVHMHIAKKLRISLDQWFDSIDSTYAKSIEGLLPEDKTLETISKNVKTTQKRLRKIIVEAYDRSFKQNQQLFKKIFELKKQGYKIAVLSDQWHLSKEALMPPRLYKRFDEVVVSCDVGMRKPNPKMYKLILKRLKLPAKQVLFIDNQEWNIKPAKKLSMRTILYKDNKQLFKELDKLGI